jgi:hypothetical protein
MTSTTAQARQARRARRALMTLAAASAALLLAGCAGVGASGALDVQPITVVRTDVETPALPEIEELLQGPGTPPPYAVLGPGAGELTLVIWGNGCPTRPRSFDASAAPDTLAILSATDGLDCTEPLIGWTTVIELPAERPAPSVVTVDDVEAVVLDPTSPAG